MHIHGQKVPDALPETQIQFHPDMQHFLVVHNSHLAIYEATELKCVNQVSLFFPLHIYHAGLFLFKACSTYLFAPSSYQWDPKVSVVISQATFSSDGHTVYATFVDGTLAIFGSSDFQMHCRIHPSAYLSSTSRYFFPLGQQFTIITSNIFPSQNCILVEKYNILLVLTS